MTNAIQTIDLPKGKLVEVLHELRDLAKFMANNSCKLVQRVAPSSKAKDVNTIRNPEFLGLRYVDAFLMDVSDYIELTISNLGQMEGVLQELVGGKFLKVDMTGLGLSKDLPETFQFIELAHLRIYRIYVMSKNLDTVMSTNEPNVDEFVPPWLGDTSPVGLVNALEALVVELVKVERSVAKQLAYFSSKF